MIKKIISASEGKINGKTLLNAIKKRQEALKKSDLSKMALLLLKKKQTNGFACCHHTFSGLQTMKQQ